MRFTPVGGISELLKKTPETELKSAKKLISITPIFRVFHPILIITFHAFQNTFSKWQI